MRSRLLLIIALAPLAGCVDMVVSGMGYDTSGMTVVTETALVVYHAHPGTYQWETAEALALDEPIWSAPLASIPGIDLEGFEPVDAFVCGDVKFTADDTEGMAWSGKAFVEVDDGSGLAWSERIMLHEFTHVHVGRQHGGTTRHVILEGLARYVEAMAHEGVIAPDGIEEFMAIADAHIRAELREVLTSVGYVRLGDLLQGSAAGENDYLLYVEGAGLVREIVAVVGWEGFWSLYGDSRSWTTSVAGYNELLVERTGLSLAEYDARIIERAGLVEAP